MSYRTMVERPALLWLGETLKLPKEIDLRKLIDEIDRNGSKNLYTCAKIPKANGFRIIKPPVEKLHIVQDYVLGLLNDHWARHPCTFGFSGGSIPELLDKHLKNQSGFMWDAKDAFGSIKFHDLKKILAGKLNYLPSLMICKLCMVCEPSNKFNAFPFFGLPQGSPTSPKLFDMACRPLDHKLNELALQYNGTYTRYADNFLVSSPEEFPSELKTALLLATREMFYFHKVTEFSCEKSVPVLGYSIHRGSVNNRVRIKKRLRKSLHHLKKVRELGLDQTDARAIAHGLWAWSSHAEMPDWLRDSAIETLYAER